MPRDRSPRGDRKASSFTTRPGCLGAVARFWYRSYAADYISLALVIAGWFLVRACRLSPVSCSLLTDVLTKIRIFAEPFHRMFSLDDVSIQYPFATVERVPFGKPVLRCT